MNLINRHTVEISVVQPYSTPRLERRASKNYRLVNLFLKLSNLSFFRDFDYSHSFLGRDNDRNSPNKGIIREKKRNQQHKMSALHPQQ